MVDVLVPNLKEGARPNAFTRWKNHACPCLGNVRLSALSFFSCEAASSETKYKISKQTTNR